MMFPMTKKNENTIPPTYLHSPSRNPGPGKRPLKKKKKRNVNDIPNDKNKTKRPYLNRNPGPGKRPLKKKKKKGKLKTFPKKKTNKSSKKKLTLLVQTVAISSRKLLLQKKKEKH